MKNEDTHNSISGKLEFYQPAEFGRPRTLTFNQQQAVMLDAGATKLAKLGGPQKAGVRDQAAKLG